MRNTELAGSGIDEENLVLAGGGEIILQDLTVYREIYK